MPARALLVAIVLSMPACGDDLPPPPPRLPAPSQVTGTIVSLAEGSPQEITGLTVETSEGDRFELLIDPDIDYGFDLTHLFEHRDTGDPVLVQVDDRDGTLYALSIDDA